MNEMNTQLTGHSEEERFLRSLLHERGINLDDLEIWYSRIHESTSCKINDRLIFCYTQDRIKAMFLTWLAKNGFGTEDGADFLFMEFIADLTKEHLFPPVATNE